MAKLKYHNGQEWEQLAPNMEEYNTTIGWVEDVETDLDTHKAEDVTDDGGVHGLEIERGTWTPYFYDVDGAIGNYDIQEGVYHKIGKLVYVSCRLNSTHDYSGTGPSSGQISLRGLPFTANGVFTASISLVVGFELSSEYGEYGLSAYTSSISPAILIRKNSTNYDINRLLLRSHISKDGFNINLSCLYEIN